MAGGERRRGRGGESCGSSLARECTVRPCRRRAAAAAPAFCCVCACHNMRARDKSKCSLALNCRFFFFLSLFFWQRTPFVTACCCCCCCGRFLSLSLFLLLWLALLPSFVTCCRGPAAKNARPFALPQAAAAARRRPPSLDVTPFCLKSPPPPPHNRIEGGKGGRTRLGRLGDRKQRRHNKAVCGACRLHRCCCAHCSPGARLARPPLLE